jgi:hypothetical protein
LEYSLPNPLHTYKNVSSSQDHCKYLPLATSVEIYHGFPFLLHFITACTPGILLLLLSQWCSLQSVKTPRGKIPKLNRRINTFSWTIIFRSGCFAKIQVSGFFPYITQTLLFFPAFTKMALFILFTLGKIFYLLLLFRDWCPMLFFVITFYNFHSRIFGLCPTLWHSVNKFALNHWKSQEKKRKAISTSRISLDCSCNFYKKTFIFMEESKTTFVWPLNLWAHSNGWTFNLDNRLVHKNRAGMHTHSQLEESQQPATKVQQLSLEYEELQ